MLTKMQLKDAARCCGGLCELCSCNKTRMAYQDCIREAAKTALAYREMLERARKTLQDAWDDDGSAVIGNQILETINAIDAFFEDAICSEKLQKELTEQKKHFEVALKIMKKWNGEGECKYCKTPSKYLAVCQNYETRVFVGISGEYLQIFDEDYPGFCDNHKINFCPMCGRKLG